MSLTALSRLCSSYSVARATSVVFTPAASSFASRVSNVTNQGAETLKPAGFGLRRIQTQAEENTEKELRELKEEIISLRKDVIDLRSDQSHFITTGDLFMLFGATVFCVVTIRLLRSDSSAKDGTENQDLKINRYAYIED